MTALTWNGYELRMDEFERLLMDGGINEFEGLSMERSKGARNTDTAIILA